MDPPAPWQMLEASLDDTVVNYPNRPIIVAFGSHWCIAAFYPWVVLYQPENTNRLTEAGFICIVADMTKGNELAQKELKQLNKIGPPVTAIFDPISKTWSILPQEFTAQDLDEAIDAIVLNISEQPPGAKPE